MKEGEIITGRLAGFTYVGKVDSYCRVTVVDGDGTKHRGIIGKAENYRFIDMLSLRGADAPVTMEYAGKRTHEGQEYDQYINVEFSLEKEAA